MKTLKKHIKKDSPNLIFAEVYSDQLIDDITRMVKSIDKNLKVYVIKDSASLRLVQQNAAGYENGVFVILFKFSRGFDIKLGKDSKVIILANAP